MKLTDYAEGLSRLGNVVFAMEREGVPIDREVCSYIATQATLDAAETLRSLDAMAGALTGAIQTNWNYWKWLADFLHGPRPSGLGISPSPFWKKGLVNLSAGEVKTDDRALEWLGWKNPAHRPLLEAIRTYRRQTRVAVYARSWLDIAIFHQKDGSWRLHPSYGMASDSDDRPGARTGRFAVKNPPLQQVPRDPKKDQYGVRRAFVAPPGHKLLVVDYSQLELVVLAHLCVKLFGATALRDSLAPGAPDLHSATAKFIFGDVLGNRDMLEASVDDIKGNPALSWRRDKVKELRYGLNYRKGAWGFGSTLFDVNGNALGEDSAQTMMDALYRMHPEIRLFQDWADSFIARHRAIPSLLGRWLPLPDGDSSTDWRRRRAQRQGSNAPMQAGGQEIMTVAMVKLHDLGYRQTLQVHDELHILVDEADGERACEDVRSVLEGAVPLEASLRAVAHVADNWGDAK